MKKHTNSGYALRSTILQYLRQQAKPVPLTQVHALAKRNGYTPSASRFQIHELSRLGQVEFYSDPTTVTVMAKGVE